MLRLFLEGEICLREYRKCHNNATPIPRDFGGMNCIYRKHWRNELFGVHHGQWVQNDLCAVDKERHVEEVRYFIKRSAKAYSIRNKIRTLPFIWCSFVRSATLCWYRLNSVVCYMSSFFVSKGLVAGESMVTVSALRERGGGKQIEVEAWVHPKVRRSTVSVQDVLRLGFEWWGEWWDTTASVSHFWCCPCQFRRRLQRTVRKEVPLEGKKSKNRGFWPAVWWRQNIWGQE